jgi:hypothetical protein
MWLLSGPQTMVVQLMVHETQNGEICLSAVARFRGLVAFDSADCSRLLKNEGVDQEAMRSTNPHERNTKYH